MNTLDISPVRVWRYNEERRRLLGKQGILRLFSVLRVGPTGMSGRTPYVVGLVQVGDELVIAQLADIQMNSLKKGMKLRGRVRRLFDITLDGVIVYGIKFTPDFEENT